MDATQKNLKAESIIFYAFYGFGVLILTISQSILPEQNFYDGKVIQSYVASSQTTPELFDSFTNTALIYKLLGMGSVLPEWIAGFIGYSSSFILILIILKRMKWRFHPIPIILFGGWNIFLAVYLGQFSKEPWALLTVGLFLILSETKKGLFLGLSLVILYAIFFRVYYFLILFFFGLNYLLLRLKFTPIKIIIFQLIAAFAVFYATTLITGSYLSEAKDKINIEREEEGDNATRIENPYDNTSNVTDTLNTVTNWVKLLFPVFLITVSPVKYVPFILFQLVNVFLFIYLIRYFTKNSELVRVYLGEGIQNMVFVSLAWCLSFSLVQAIFEPDFGSFIRHETVLLPMLIFLLATRFGLLSKSNLTLDHV